MRRRFKTGACATSRKAYGGWWTSGPCARQASPAGRTRLVAAIQDAIAAETNTSTGTRSRLIRRVTKALEDTYGLGVVPVPAKTTFYRLIGVLATGRHTFGSAVTRRQAANRPDGPFTPTAAVRPGEQVQVDSTPLDVMVLLDGGVAVRAELTIAVDVATRTICAAVLRPVGTKAVDAALLLARMLVPEPMRPGWSASLAMAASRLPHVRLVDVDTRMEQAAAKPVIVPDTIVIDGGRVFISDTFIRACERLGISVQKARPGTPTDKPRVAYCTSSGRSVRSCGSGWSGVLGSAADLRPVGRVVGVGRVVKELSFVVIAGAGDNSGSAPGLDGVVVDGVGGGGFGEGEHAGVAEALAAAA